MKLQTFTSWIYYLCGILKFTSTEFENHAKVFAMHMALPKIIQGNASSAERYSEEFQKFLTVSHISYNTFFFTNKMQFIILFCWI